MFLTILHAFLIFAVCLAGDFLWTKWMVAVNEKRAIKAANSSVLIYLIGAFSIISYNSNHWFLIPALLGCWLGTYIAVVNDTNKTTQEETSELLLD